MTGLSAHPTGTLLDRVLTELRAGPARSGILCAGVLGMPNAPRAVAERLLLALLGADPRVHRLADGRWALVAEAQDSPLLDECAFAVVDVETTGMRARGGDRITEIAVVVVQGGRRELVYESLVNPERPIPAMIARMTRISDDMVRSAPRFADIADEVLGALGGRVFVAHNARFDWSFVSAELDRARDVALDGPRVCTVRLARKLVREVQSCGLDNLSQHFGLANPARHRAAGDAMATADLLGRLMDRARERGARTLQDLEAMAETRAIAARRRRRSAMPTEPRGDSAAEGPQ
ncbi:MAG TPA: exonuclease domain-containing protein [Gemmatimonadales bacterium]|nr:exonuclease domain-containing protein [Gemmatimonadales bacterium]